MFAAARLSTVWIFTAFTPALALTDGRAITPLDGSSGAYSAAVSIISNGKTCTAVRVDKKAFLLAGHCGEDLGLKPRGKVRLLSFDGKRKEARVVKIALHPLYAYPTKTASADAIRDYLDTSVDLAILWLNLTNMKGEGFEQSRRLAMDEFSELPVGAPVRAVGGGCEKVNPFTAACEGGMSADKGYLKTAYRKIAEPHFQGEALPTGRYYYATASSAQKSLGPGDSGGPLFDSDGKLVAIHSLITGVSRGGMTSLLNYHVKLAHPGIASWLRDRLGHPRRQEPSGTSPLIAMRSAGPSASASEKPRRRGRSDHRLLSPRAENLDATVDN